jgi:hypothetical protein
MKGSRSAIDTRRAVARSLAQRQREAGGEAQDRPASASQDASGGITSGPAESAAAELPDLNRLKRYFTEHEQLTYESRRNSLTAIDYYDTDQFTREELTELHARGQPAIVINRIKPAINGIIGVTERGRSDPKAWPRNPGDADSADVATDVLRYIADFNRFRRLKQDVFRDILIPGTGAALVGADADSQVTITQIRWEEFERSSAPTLTSSRASTRLSETCLARSAWRRPRRWPQPFLRREVRSQPRRQQSARSRPAQGGSLRR